MYIMGGKKRLIHKLITRKKAADNSKDSSPHHLTPKTSHKEKHDSGHVHHDVNPQSHHHLPGYHHQKKKHPLKKLLKIDHDFPPGVKLLIVFSSIMCFLYIILASMFSFTMVLGMTIQGAASRFLNIMMILVLSALIIGFAKKKMWAYHLSFGVFGFIILNSLVSMFFIKKSVSGSLTLLTTFSLFFMLLMNFIILWYIKSKKNYFLHHYHPNHMTKEDKALIYGLTLLWVVFIFAVLIFGYSYYSETTKKADMLIEELYLVYPYQVEDYCLQKIEDKDLCLLTGAVMYEKEKINTAKLCRDIDSQFYRYTCFKAIQGEIA